MPDVPTGTVAYVLKGWPRMSELFIASEIHRLECAGVALRLYVLKAAGEAEHHPVVDRIRVRPEYLPATTLLSGVSLAGWLGANLGPFLPALARTARRRPLGLMRAAAMALAQAVRSRPACWSLPPKLMVRERCTPPRWPTGCTTRPTCVICTPTSAHGCTTVTWLAAAITGLPFSFTGHAKDIYTSRLNPAGLLRRKLLAARFAVTCTGANRRHLLAIAPEATVHRVYHGLNADFARLLAEDGGVPRTQNGLRLLSVGRLVEKKGFDVVVDACALRRDHGVPFEALLAGPDDEAADAIRGRIAAAGLHDHVRLAGQLSQAKLLTEYRRASALCLPAACCRTVIGTAFPTSSPKPWPGAPASSQRRSPGSPSSCITVSTGCSCRPTTRLRWPARSCAWPASPSSPSGLVASGLPNKLIARRLDISEKTVKAHLTRIYHALDVSDRTQAALWVSRQRGTDEP